ncbi:MAG: hypothetical protein CMF80_03935 [Candidatus Marinimicrobia bacterium]|nr:hypothetical protein [Candidatus Neomarinimicrobiota bacterium]|tara:strand:- start:274 stop:1524 length:1251 start_codon:yes stop_codon:yes gene_type:complete
MINLILSFSFLLIISRNYGASVLGLFTISQSFLYIFSIFSRLGLDVASIRLIPEYNQNSDFNQIKNFYFFSFILIIIVSLLMSYFLFVNASRISTYFFDKLDLINYLKIIALTLPAFSILTWHSEIFRGFKNLILYLFFRQTFISLFSIIIIICAILSLKSTYYSIISFSISVYLSLFLSFVFIINHIKLRKIKKIDFNFNFIKVLKISVPMMLTSSIMLFMNWTDTIILGYYKTEYDVGIYSVVMKISMLCTINLFAINSIVAPKFSELYFSKNKKEFKKIILKSSKLIFISTLPILLFIVILHEKILLLFGEEFNNGKLALFILLIGQGINSISGSVGFILQMTGKQNTFQKIVILSLVSNIFLNIILIPKFGLVGAATSSVVSYIIWNLLSVYKIYKFYNILTIYYPYKISNL